MKEDKLNNYITINRRLFKHFLWNEKRPFSRFEAWLDLVQSARFEITEARKLIGGKLVDWHRSEIPISLRYLAERWNWSKNRVDNFLKMLENEGMIEKKTASGTSQTVISLCNYDNYNIKEEKKGQQEGHTRDTNVKTSGQRSDKTNKENKVNKENKENTAPAPPTYSPEEKKGFDNFCTWIARNAPRVQQMKEPFTIEQYVTVRKDLNTERLRNLLTAMHNWQPLTTKNRSAYLTLLNWKRMEDERNVNANTSNENGVSAIHKARQKENQQ